jgi:hypothetical protein
MTSGPIYLNRTKAAQLIRDRFGIRCQPQTLAKLASIGGGPIFHKAGSQALYTEADLIIWAQTRISGPRASTSAPMIEQTAA